MCFDQIHALFYWKFFGKGVKFDGQKDPKSLAPSNKLWALVVVSMQKNTHVLFVYAPWICWAPGLGFTHWSPAFSGMNFPGNFCPSLLLDEVPKNTTVACSTRLCRHLEHFQKSRDSCWVCFFKGTKKIIKTMWCTAAWNLMWSEQKKIQDQTQLQWTLKCWPRKKHTANSWWFRNPSSPVEVGSFSHYFQGFKKKNEVVVWDFFHQ